MICLFQAGHLKMLEGYVDFFMDPNLAECYSKLKEELDKLVQKKVRKETRGTSQEYFVMLAFSILLPALHVIYPMPLL